ncbi:hypothetical protein QE152_g5104 [Popillia japonica]|uniref:Uncharacterized protein n=1 Tax=Popillia japonica TaxID=7064 RepID=A0AAW1MZM6_POPJA
MSSHVYREDLVLTLPVAVFPGQDRSAITRCRSDLNSRPRITVESTFDARDIFARGQKVAAMPLINPVSSIGDPHAQCRGCNSGIFVKEFNYRVELGNVPIQAVI